MEPEFTGRIETGKAEGMRNIKIFRKNIQGR
jgi:hypothetical protein